tara:strand:- start:403 stop:2172 length:1770 start_codon:yes stop_codon:yes gene_type:complete
MKYTLVCDSEKKNWPENENLYYLGYWCLEKEDQSFQNLDRLKIINCEERNDSQTKEDLVIINDLYYALIDDLTVLLNKIHKKNFSKKFWEIVIGPWTKVFIGIVYERYLSIKKVLSLQEIEKIILVNYTKLDFTNDNVADLEFKASNNINQWNTVLYTILYEFLDKTKKNKIEKFEIIKNKINRKNSKKSFKKLSITFLNKLNSSYLIKKDFFIYQFDLKLKYLIYLFFSLKQFPTILTERNYKKKKIDLNLRNSFSFKKENVSEFERFVRKNLNYFLPTDLIENFDNLLLMVEKTNWPKNPKYIFTSFGYHADEVFGIYLASKVEKKTKYILHQHGSNYFTGKNTIVDYGFNSCDKFISWGNPIEEKCIPLFNTKNLDVCNNTTTGENILFFGPKMSANRKRPFDEYGKIIRDSIMLEKIMNNLNENLKKKIIIKLYNLDPQSRDLEKKILNDIIFRNNEFHIDRSKINQSLVDKSKILVHSGDGTAFLESLAIKKPTICFLENLNWVREEVREDYEDLIKAKIIFSKHDELSSHINEFYNQIDKWWCDTEVEKTRIKFCEKYSQPASKNGINEISKLLKDIINGKYN